MTNPYQSNPQPITPPNLPLEPQPKPQVCIWYNIYCSCFALLYILTAIGGLAVAIFATQIAEASGEPDKQAAASGNFAAGIVMSVISIPLTILFIVGLMIPRKTWGWGYGFIPIAIGLTSPCCLPASLPLMLYWLRADNKRWFNVQ
jgi:hypothetical protein